MNHIEVWQQETATSQKEQLWLIWIKRAENQLGHSIDMDEWKDGYSLDGAFDYFNRGFKSSEYVKQVRAEKLRIKTLNVS